MPWGRAVLLPLAVKLPMHCALSLVAGFVLILSVLYLLSHYIALHFQQVELQEMQTSSSSAGMYIPMPHHRVLHSLLDTNIQFKCGHAPHKISPLGASPVLCCLDKLHAQVSGEWRLSNPLPWPWGKWQRLAGAKCFSVPEQVRADRDMTTSETVETAHV